MSEADAQAMADQRAAEALGRAMTDTAFPRREPKVPYNGAEGVPIREAIVEEHDDVVITRNAYGARCLNVADVVFADVDFGDPFPRASSPLVGVAYGILAALVGHAIGLGIVAVVLVGFAFHISWPFVVHVASRALLPAFGGEIGVVRMRVARFVARQPASRIAIYRTPAGARLLWLHRRAPTDDPQVLAFFEAVHVDPMYARMCSRQRCFRARVSAKPWRAGCTEHIVPRPGTHPIHPSIAPMRDAWIARYEARAENFAACEFVEEIGDALADRSVARVQELHDRLCRVGRGLPLA